MTTDIPPRTPAERMSRANHPSSEPGGRVLRMGMRREFEEPVDDSTGPIQANTPENLEATQDDPQPPDPAGIPAGAENPAETPTGATRARALAAVVCLVLGLSILTTGIALWLGVPIALTTLGALTTIVGFLLGRDT